jgi:hypothetical protein
MRLCCCCCCCIWCFCRWFRRGVDLVEQQGRKGRGRFFQTTRCGEYPCGVALFTFVNTTNGAIAAIARIARVGHSVDSSISMAVLLLQLVLLCRALSCWIGLAMLLDQGGKAQGALSTIQVMLDVAHHGSGLRRCRLQRMWRRHILYTAGTTHSRRRHGVFHCLVWLSVQSSASGTAFPLAFLERLLGYAQNQSTDDMQERREEDCKECLEGGCVRETRKNGGDVVRPVSIPKFWGAGVARVRRLTYTCFFAMVLFYFCVLVTRFPHTPW